MRYIRVNDAASGYDVQTVLAVPFESVARGGVMGVCQLFNKKVTAGQELAGFTSDDEAALDMALRVAALDMENGRLTAECAELD